MQLLSKFHYEKIWQKTSEKDLTRILQDEMPEIPIEETLAFIKAECDKGKVVNFINISIKKEA